jgi:cellulose synthase/poly-beta-1,6-N-acetylglucosamine synthase-like glycosyltransferase
MDSRAMTLAVGVLLTVAVALGGAQTADSPREPERPRVRVEVPDMLASGRSIRVAGDGDLQAAIDEAEPGDLILLEPRATYHGPFRLRKKERDGWIVIASAARDLPSPGRRVTPADAAKMPKLVAAAGSVFETEPGAHHYRLVGLEITSAPGTSLVTLVQLGAGTSDAAQLPHHIIIDRCYLHGDARLGGRRGVALNSSHTAVIDSHLSDFKERGVDAQAIAGWNGPGPFKISGNYLEASGENVMFGGADPGITDLVPADIEVTRNHMSKPLRWKKDDPSFEGTAWSVKNLFELKNARRVLVDGNLLEYNWPHAQNGFAVLFTVRNQDGGAPWSVVEDVTFSNNLVRHVGAGINVLGRDDNHPSRQTRRIIIRNNVFHDVGGRWGGGRLFQLLDGTAEVTIDHNTAFQTGGILFGGDGAPHAGFVFQNNVMPHNEYGIIGSGTAPGTSSLERYFPGAVVRRNVLAGGPAGRYPRDNFFPASLEKVAARGTADLRRLELGSEYAATDGREPGADVAELEKALGGLATLEAQVQPKPDATNVAPAYVVSGFSRTWKVIFWVAAVLLAYVYVGYALIEALRARLRPKTQTRASIEPRVSVVVVAHNEAGRIAARIEDLLALDYPRNRLQVVIASDGSTDATVDRARTFEGAIVTVLPFSERRGKAAVLNVVVPYLRGEVIVFADARQRFEPGTLRALVENFADPQVGAVSGELVLTAGDGTAAAGRGTAVYWRYEKFVRSTEARADSTVGATGAIYAIRRALFEPIPNDTILDDVVIPLRIVRRGFRVLFEARARAYDRASLTARQEFARKARTIAGTFQLFSRERWLWNPRRNRLWFETMSHKALRLTVPLLHAAVLIAAIGATPQGAVYGLALVAQLVFYSAAVAGFAAGRRMRRLPMLSVACAICLLNWATVVGFIRFLTKRQQVTWERIPTSGIPSTA